MVLIICLYNVINDHKSLKLCKNNFLIENWKLFQNQTLPGSIHIGSPNQGGRVSQKRIHANGGRGQRQMQTSAKCVIFELNCNFKCLTQLINK